MTEKVKKSEFSKKFFTFLVTILVLGCVSAFAAGDSIEELDTWGEKILGLATAPWVRSLMTVALIIEFGIIGFGNTQGEGGMFKKVWPWLVGTVGIMGASSIADFFWGTT